MHKIRLHNASKTNNSHDFQDQNIIEKSETNYPKVIYIIFYIFAAYLVLHIIDIPLLGLSISAPLFFIVAVAAVLKPPSPWFKQNQRWILFSSLIFISVFLSTTFNGMLSSGVVLDLLYVGRIPWIGAKLVKKLRYPYDLTKESYVQVISGSAMMFRGETLKRVGGFDERFFLCGEDIELCDRFWQRGYKVFYCPGAVIVHYNQSCSPQDPANIFVNKFLGVAKYYELKNGKWTHFCFRAITYIILLPKLLIKIIFYFITGNVTKSKMNLSILQKLIKWRLVGEAKSYNL